MPDNYDVAFSAIRIRNTRSRHQDTLWIRISVSVDGQDRGTANWDGTGGRDKNNGYFDGLRNAQGKLIGVSTGPITDGSAVKVSFLVLNSGHTPNEKAYSDALAAISSAATTYGGLWGYLIGSLTAVASLFVGANCDGPVAADAFTVTGKQIREGINVHPYYNWVNPSGYIGPNSPQGCGSNSNYDAVVQFTRHS